MGEGKRIPRRFVCTINNCTETATNTYAGQDICDTHFERLTYRFCTSCDATIDFDKSLGNITIMHMPNRDENGKAVHFLMNMGS